METTLLICSLLLNISNLFLWFFCKENDNDIDDLKHEIKQLKNKIK